MPYPIEDDPSHILADHADHMYPKAEPGRCLNICPRNLGDAGGIRISLASGPQARASFACCYRISIVDVDSDKIFDTTRAPILSPECASPLRFAAGAVVDLDMRRDATKLSAIKLRKYRRCGRVCAGFETILWLGGVDLVGRVAQSLEPR